MRPLAVPLDAQPDRVQRYTNIAIAFHWLIALAILGNLALGKYTVAMELSPQKLKFFSYHKWLGVTIFGLVVLRIVWRLTHRPPTLPDGMRAWEKRVAHASHFMLYALTLAVPLTGWLFSSASGFKTVYLGLLPIPDLLGKDKAVADALKFAHHNLNFVMTVLVLLHVLAALKHHFRDRDDVLARMVPGLRSRAGAAHK